VARRQGGARGVAGAHTSPPPPAAVSAAASVSTLSATQRSTRLLPCARQHTQHAPAVTSHLRRRRLCRRRAAACSVDASHVPRAHQHASACASVHRRAPRRFTAGTWRAARPRRTTMCARRRDGGGSAPHARAGTTREAAGEACAAGRTAANRAGRRCMRTCAPGGARARAAGCRSASAAEPACTIHPTASRRSHGDPPVSAAPGRASPARPPSAAWSKHARYAAPRRARRRRLGDFSTPPAGCARLRQRPRRTRTPSFALSRQRRPPFRFAASAPGLAVLCCDASGDVSGHAREAPTPARAAVGWLAPPPQIGPLPQVEREENGFPAAML
jgi:hypothetical protein